MPNSMFTLSIAEENGGEAAEHPSLRAVAPTYASAPTTIAPIDRSQCPPALALRAENLPLALHLYPHWVCWRWLRRSGIEGKPDKWTKPPVDPNTGCAAQTNTPTTWGTYHEALTYYEGRPIDIAGIGFVFADTDPYVGIDLDHCVDPISGEVAPWAQEILALFGTTYAERSPSGTGIKILISGRLPGTGRKNGHVEAYDTRRFFTLTGHRLPGAGIEIAPRQEALAVFYERWFGGQASENGIQRAKVDRDDADAARQSTIHHISPASPVSLDLAGLDGARIWAETAPSLSSRMRACALGDDTVCKQDGRLYDSGSNREQAVLCALLEKLDDNAAVAAFLATPRGATFLTRNEAREPNMLRRLGRAVASGRRYMEAHPPPALVPWFVVDRAILDHAVAIKPVGVALFVALAEHLPDRRPSEEHLATRHLGINARTVRNHLPTLTERGLVTVHRERVHWEKTRNHYTLIATGATPIVLPRRLLTVGLDVTTIAVYTMMAGDGDTESVATIDEVATRLGVRRQRVGPACEALIDHGLVVSGKRLRSAPQLYYLAERLPVNVRFLPPIIHEERGGRFTAGS